MLYHVLRFHFPNEKNAGFRRNHFLQKLPVFLYSKISFTCTWTSLRRYWSSAMQRFSCSEEEWVCDWQRLTTIDIFIYFGFFFKKTWGDTALTSAAYWNYKNTMLRMLCSLWCGSCIDAISSYFLTCHKTNILSFIQLPTQKIMIEFLSARLSLIWRHLKTSFVLCTGYIVQNINLNSIHPFTYTA